MHGTRYLVGVLTLCGAIAAAWLLWGFLEQRVEETGMILRVEFNDARGLRRGADVRYRGVRVGGVRSVSISDDGGKAVAELQLDESGAAQACVNSSFWVVTPRFSGLTSGVSGLDTIVRSPYVTFHTPEERGSLLAVGSLVGGLENPPAWVDRDSLPPAAQGDLLMTLLAPENHGVQVGSPIVFRGTTTGDVRRVSLSSDGSHVEIHLRIARQYRSTVRDVTQFWIARPYVSGALLTGFTVSDVDALLSPFVSYQTDPGRGLPVEDGFRAIASTIRPEQPESDVPTSALKVRPVVAEQNDGPLVLVRVVYSAVEKDTFSADDDVHREGTGMLYLTTDGRAAVLTSRSIVDASYTESDPLGGDPDIGKESIKIMLSEGTVLRAHRVWVASLGHDLAILVVDAAPPNLKVTESESIQFDFDLQRDTDAQIVAMNETGEHLAWQELDRSEMPDLDLHCGAAVVVERRAVAVYGQASGHRRVPKVVPLNLVPEDLRPR